MSQDYNKTLNLPKTDFPMRGNLPKREPDTLQKWEDEDLYEQMIAKNEGKPKYILHDGPPYANGEIHLGTALNKTLKDFIVKYKNMSGFCAPYGTGLGYSRTANRTEGNEVHRRRKRCNSAGRTAETLQRLCNDACQESDGTV